MKREILSTSHTFRSSTATPEYKKDYERWLKLKSVDPDRTKPVQFKVNITKEIIRAKRIKLCEMLKRYL